MLELKKYQCEALEVLEAYLSACRVSGGPEASFRASLVRQGIVSAAGAGAVRYVKPLGLENIPYVCIRIPTGGGKTILAAYAIEVARRAFLRADFPLVLWLVPSNTIREQTMACLATAGHPYRRALEERFGQDIRLFDIGGLEGLAPQDLGSKLVVVVGTIQSLRVSDQAGRRIYAHSEDWERHFARAPSLAGLDVEGEGARKGRAKHSFVNLCRLFRPFIVMDEAHNARTSLTFETFERLDPAGILELTATPDADPKNGSNVLFSVSATELKAEHMIKLPIHLAEHASWKEAVGAAVRERARLALIADGESRYLRPIVLFQAENKDREVTAELLRKHLFDNEGATEDEVAVVTGSVRELDGVDLFSRKCTIKYIITVQALKEGWDCSFAYVFCSVANIASAKDVEQLLGRVLRLPEARPFEREELNRSYAHVSSQSFSDAAAALRDKLVEKLGFERIEAELYVDPAAAYLLPPEEGAGFATESIAADYGSVSVTVDAEPDFALIAAPLRERVFFERREGRLLVTVKGAIDEGEATAIADLVATGPRAEAIRRAITTYRAVSHNAAVGPITERLILPELGFFEGVGGPGNHPPGAAENATILESGHFAGLGGFSLARGELVSQLLSEAEFDPRRDIRTSEIDIERGKVTYSYGGNEVAEQGWLYTTGDSDWERSRLLGWLDGELRAPDIFQHEMQAFLIRVIRALEDHRGFKPGELLVYKYALVDALKAKLAEARRKAGKQGFELFAGAGTESGAPRRELALVWSFAFDRDRPPYTRPQDLVAGGYRFRKHFFPMIQDIKDRGEELECAKVIDGRIPEIQTWVRNIPRRPESFRLPTSGGEFYPDFVCLLEDDRVMVVEYKGEMLKDNLDELEKKAIGETWARTSGGKALFVWATRRDAAGRDVEGQIRACLKKE
ncbi:MAG: DEAD/DEAH box helicase family protein [Spirochaetota bacterium]